MRRRHLITVKLYGFDSLATEIAKIKEILEESKKELLKCERFTEIVDFVLIDIKSENYCTGENKSRCVVETVFVGEDTGLKSLATDVVLISLEKLFDGKNVLFLRHRH